MDQHERGKLPRARSGPRQGGRRSPERDRAAHVDDPGDAGAAAYRAMCSLFLVPANAWVFDGYADAPGFREFDGQKSANFLCQAGLKVDVDDAPNQDAQAWRKRAGVVLDADLALVMTKGNARDFDREHSWKTREHSKLD